MNIAIDAYNIKEGGGVIHLCNLIKCWNPNNSSKMYIVCNNIIKEELKKIAKDSVILIYHSYLDSWSFKKIFFDIFVFPRLLKRLKVSVLFCPGGLFPFRKIKNIKLVAMGQNVLPFSNLELRRAGFLLTVRRLLLRRMLLRSFNVASAVIFPSSFSKNIIEQFLHKKVVHRIICHGVDLSFFRRNDTYQFDVKNIRLLYVSSMKFYKNQDEVIRALSILHQRGYKNISVQFVGAQNKKVKKRLSKLVGRLELNDDVQFVNSVAYKELSRFYFNASIFVFSSSCETFGIPLVEAMASGLPIACSSCQPFPEIVKDAAIYFESKIPKSIADAIEILITDENVRNKLIERAVMLSKTYSCEKCAEDTFSFLREVARVD